MEGLLVELLHLPPREENSAMYRNCKIRLKFGKITFHRMPKRFSLREDREAMAYLGKIICVSLPFVSKPFLCVSPTLAQSKMQNTLGTLRLLEGPRTKKNAEQREELRKKRSEARRPHPSRPGRRPRRSSKMQNTLGTLRLLEGPRTKKTLSKERS